MAGVYLTNSRLSHAYYHAHRSAVVSLIIGFWSLGVSLLRDAGLISDKETYEIEFVVSRIAPKKRLPVFWNR